MINYLSRWAVLDTETSGLNSEQDRVISIAVTTLDENLQEVESWSTLVNANVDPGATEIHGITPEHLIEAPSFAEIAPKLLELLSGKVLVAHNASFDLGFLEAEAKRAGVALTHAHTLCSLVLARQLRKDLGVYSLAALAENYGVKQTRAHDAADDVKVLVEVFRQLHQEAKMQERKLYPLKKRWAAKTPAATCPWPNPGRFEGELIQGMRVAFTGGDENERTELERRSVELGLGLASSVSGKTSLLVSDGFSGSKTRKAQEVNCPTLSYTEYAELLNAGVRASESA